MYIRYYIYAYLFKQQEITIIMLFVIVLIFVIYFIIALENTLIFFSMEFFIK